MGTILHDIKALLGIGDDDDAFDEEILLDINSVGTILTQLGIGPEDGIEITDKMEWKELVGERKDLQIIRSYIFMKVRLLFDPPQNSFLVSSIEKQCQEYEWRIEVQASPSTTDPELDEKYSVD